MKIAAVVVIYNRFELLKECVRALKNQTYKLDEIIVVNNGSTDGTNDWLNKQKEIIVINQENLGSAGGQYSGIKYAYESGCDWIWSLDVDVIPNKNALEKFLSSKELSDKNLGFLSSVIYYKDGNLAFINIPYLDNEFNIVYNYIKGKSLPIITASFGSVLFSRKAIAKSGLPIKDFFIWGDDAEYTLRIIKNGFNGFLIKESKAIHYAPNNFPNPFDALVTKDKKFLIGLRNTIFVIKLRNQVLYNSKIRGILSAFYFAWNLAIDRIRNGKQNFIDTLLFLMYFIKGIFFNPKINLKD